MLWNTKNRQFVETASKNTSMAVLSRRVVIITCFGRVLIGLL